MATPPRLFNLILDVYVLEKQPCSHWFEVQKLFAAMSVTIQSFKFIYNSREISSSLQQLSYNLVLLLDVLHGCISNTIIAVICFYLSSANNMDLMK